MAHLGRSKKRRTGLQRKKIPEHTPLGDKPPSDPFKKKCQKHCLNNSSCFTFAANMHKSFGQSGSRIVVYWLLLGVFMLLVQIILGGITRLTGSGLSITEWDVVTGALPPLNKQAWIIEFNKYRQTPQFRLLNGDFTLSDFKFIFFWEWFHRFWARMVGFIFLLGFVFLIWKKKLKQEMIRPLIILFLLGALQGAIGWVMVASGLTGDAIYVRPTRLALHFIFALGLISYCFWFALMLLVPPHKLIANKKIHVWSWAILFVLFFQFLYGALMAGNKAAATAPTWPTINGDWIPGSLLKESPARLNFIDNPVTIHFVHRGLAYLLLALTIGWTITTYRLSSVVVNEWLRKTRAIPLGIVTFQIILGISTVLTSPGIVANHWVFFDWVALFHQLTGMLFLLLMLYMIYITRDGKQAS
jgi:heme a synthase